MCVYIDRYSRALVVMIMYSTTPHIRSAAVWDQGVPVTLKLTVTMKPMIYWILYSDEDRKYVIRSSLLYIILCIQLIRYTNIITYYSHYIRILSSRVATCTRIYKAH